MIACQNHIKLTLQGFAAAGVRPAGLVGKLTRVDNYFLYLEKISHLPCSAQF